MDKCNQQKHKGLKIALNVIFYTFLGVLLAFDIFALVSKLTMKSETGAMNFFGHETRIVLTGSMEGNEQLYIDHPEYEIKRINVHDAVFIDTVPSDENKQQEFFNSIKVGDVLTFIYQRGGNVVVTHRVINIEDTGHNLKYTLRGDNPTGDNLVHDNDQYTQEVYSDRGEIIGKVTGTNTFLGNVLYGLAGNKLVLIFLVVVPSGLLALYELGKVFFAIYMNKKEKQLAIIQQEHQTDLDELEKLKQELERLKKQQTDSLPEGENNNVDSQVEEESSNESK